MECTSAPSLIRTHHGAVAPFIPSALSHLTLCSIPPSWWVIQLTIWPTAGPTRPGSTTVQAVTGWEWMRERKRRDREGTVLHSLPLLDECRKRMLPSLMLRVRIKNSVLFKMSSLFEEHPRCKNYLILKGNFQNKSENKQWCSPSP